MQPGQQQGGSGDNSLDFLWLIVLVVGIILVVWYFGKKYIAFAVFHLNLYQIDLVKFVMGFWDKIATFLHLPLADLAKLDHWAQLIQLHTAPIDFNTLAQISGDVGSYLRYPIMVILLLLAVILYFGSIALKFKTTFNMKRLRDLEKENWPRIIPVTDLDLIKQDIKKGPWAMSLTPLEFCKQRKLIREEIKEEQPVAVLISGKARNVLALQLGPLWRGPEAMPVHMQVLFAVFAARANGDSDSADKLLDQIALSSAGGRLDFSGYKKLLATHINAKNIGKTVQCHAYALTVMASMLDLARGAGVLATSEFLWLKPVDRKLWYVLNSVGRQTAVAEVAGIFSHWMAEKRLNYPMQVPMVDEAVRGMEEALAEVVYEPEEEAD